MSFKIFLATFMSGALLTIMGLAAPTPAYALPGGGLASIEKPIIHDAPVRENLETGVVEVLTKDGSWIAATTNKDWRVGSEKVATPGTTTKPGHVTNPVHQVGYYVNGYYYEDACCDSSECCADPSHNHGYTFYYVPGYPTYYANPYYYQPGPRVIIRRPSGYYYNRGYRYWNYGPRYRRW